MGSTRPKYETFLRGSQDQNIDESPAERNRPRGVSAIMNDDGSEMDRSMMNSRNTGKSYNTVQKLLYRHRKDTNQEGDGIMGRRTNQQRDDNDITKKKSGFA
jgi:hypothetical protein